MLLNMMIAVLASRSWKPVDRAGTSNYEEVLKMDNSVPWSRAATILSQNQTPRNQSS